MLAKEFFNFENNSLSELFLTDEPVWEALNKLPKYIDTLFQSLWPLAGIYGNIEKPMAIHNGKVIKNIKIKNTGPKQAVQAYLNDELLDKAAIILPGAYLNDDQIILGAGTIIEPGAMIKGPTVIGKNTEVRQGAYIRGNCLVGNNCVVGHATEIKSSIMLNGSKAGHFAYIGDSILGHDVNLGAGTKLANLKMIKGNIVISHNRKRYNTERKKLGAILGDKTETGCNSVTSPGTIMGPKSIVYPCVNVPGGYYGSNSIVAPVRNSLRIVSK